MPRLRYQPTGNTILDENGETIRAGETFEVDDKRAAFLRKRLGDEIVEAADTEPVEDGEEEPTVPREGTEGSTTQHGVLGRSEETARRTGVAEEPIKASIEESADGAEKDGSENPAGKQSGQGDREQRHSSSAQSRGGAQRSPEKES